MPKNSDNREFIQQTALNLFAERGYHSVGVQEIVTQAGMTKPTLYHYFGHKQGLLSSILAHYYGQLLEQLHVAADYQGDLVKTLTRVVTTYFDFALANPPFFYLQLAMTFVPPANEIHGLIEPYHQSRHRLLVAMLKQAVPQHGNLRNHEPMLASTLIGLLNHHALGLVQQQVKSDDFIYKVVKQYMYGIYVL